RGDAPGTEDASSRPGGGGGVDRRRGDSAPDRAAAGGAGGRVRDRAGGDEERLDLTVELVDAAGERARLPLSRYGPVRRPLDIRIHWRRDVAERRFAAFHELLLQSYSLPLNDFVADNPRLDPARLRAVRFVFDRSPAGTVVLDEIGFSTLDPAYLVASSP
ncbi:MAG: hypothetical protein ACOC8B_08050, partial [Gemmatimonadota bacterium]